MSGALVSPADLAGIAASLARSVGELIHSMRAAGVDVANTKSSITDVVTAADREAERLVTAGILEQRPDDSILGEEGARVEGRSEITWVIDPIDGTVNYLYNIPAYAVSIAATVTDGEDGTMDDGRRAIAGAVYLPVTNELFTAWEGGGAYLNGAPLSGPNDTSLSTALLATGFGYSVERRTEQAAIVSELIPQVRDIRRMGSAANDLCSLAAGRLDAYYERGLQPWDYAAAALIAREAGATIVGLDGGLPGEPMLIAAAPNLTTELHSAVSGAYSRLSQLKADRI